VLIAGYKELESRVGLTPLPATRQGGQLPRHLLTAPRSPTTRGKVERLHKTLRVA
jgi:hypothetical protein